MFIPVAIVLLLVAIYDIMRRQCIGNNNNSNVMLPPVTVSRYLITLLYTYLWAEHMSILKYIYHNNLNIHNNI